MEGEDSKAVKAVLETLATRGWCIADIDQVKALIIIQTALSDNEDPSALADSVESEMLNMDLKSIGAKSLPVANSLRKSSHLQGPKVLQVSSVRDISVSSIERFSDSSKRRLLKFTLTDGHSEITAMEFSHIPSIPNDIVAGTKVRLENKVPLHGDIACLNPEVITVIGGVVQSLYEEWEMNQKYMGLSRPSTRLSKEPDNGGPPPFEKLQIRSPFNQPSLHGKPAVAAQSHLVQNQANAGKHIKNTGHSNQYTSWKTHGEKDKQKEPQVLTLDKRIEKGNAPTTMGTPASNEFIPIDSQKNHVDCDERMTTSFSESTEQKPSSSGNRAKEVGESVPIQNQAASQKLLEKMSSANQGAQQYRGRKHKGKGRQEEQQVFTLDEWEKRKTAPTANYVPGTSCDEDLAWQLQNQLDMEDSHVQMTTHNNAADDIRMNMFSYERDGDRMEYGGSGWGRGRGKGRGRGRGRERGRY